MKAVLQRVNNAKVLINNIEEKIIDSGIVVLLGIDKNDNKEDADWLVNKIVNMRIFNDQTDFMNLSLIDINGSIMIISQFTLIASTKKGNRPSYINAASHQIAIPLYEYFIRMCKEKINDRVKAGVFGADMKIKLLNDGPVTIIIDTKDKE